LAVKQPCINKELIVFKSLEPVFKSLEPVINKDKSLVPVIKKCKQTPIDHPALPVIFYWVEKHSKSSLHYQPVIKATSVSQRIAAVTQRRAGFHYCTTALNATRVAEQN
jgi:hypothetical protein